MILKFIQIISAVIYPLLTLWIYYRKSIHKEHPTRLNERFGIISKTRPLGNIIWLHAASVGESIAMFPLVEKLIEQGGSIILFTSGTLTSQEMIANKFADKVIAQFAPIDSIISARRFLKHWQPHLIIWTESELWPVTLSLAKNYAPIFLVNGRMSLESFNNWSKIKFLIKPLLNCFAFILAESEYSTNYFKQLGAEKVVNIGNIKNSAPPLSFSQDEFDIIYSQLDLAHRQTIVLASSHEGEETIVLDCFAKLKAVFPKLLLVIVPRNTKRGTMIAEEALEISKSIAIRSLKQKLSPETQIYVADTMGELGLFYRLANVAIVGGSFLPHLAGHNILEPAKLGLPVVTGPYYESFKEIVDKMIAAKAIVVAHPENDSLFQNLQQLLTDQEFRSVLVKNATNFGKENNDILTQVLKVISNRK